MTEEKKIRVLIVDDHQVVRQGFAVFLKAFPDLEFVGEAVNGEEAVQIAVQLQPDVILMDMIMPRMTGVEATAAIRSQCPNIQVIALTSFTDNKQLVQEALNAGAIGYLFKDVSVVDLAKAIRMAYEGVPVLAPEATRLLIQAKTQRSSRDFNLSRRETEVLTLLVQGMSNAEIAEHMSVSASTIKFHVSSILGKLGASTRTEAVSIAHQYKLVT
ncbi:MAG: response regulator transcription factor [Anaerolinea sp.]|nr:response regulator transcription factor [Anaerolinea sp.]